MGKTGRKNKYYSYKYKIMVVEDYLSGNSGGLEAIAKKYEMRSHSQVVMWLKKYKDDPKLLVVENRGRKSTGRPKKSKFDEMNLEQQNEYLRMENDILKKLQALRKKRGER